MTDNDTRPSWDRGTADGRPTMSVCIPAFNGALYIGEAIRSVLGQTFEDFELLVIDDGSSDGTPDAVAHVRDERLRFVRNPLRLGMVGNWNRCLELARGRYVTVFHQDDLMAPDNLRCKVQFLEQHPTAGFVHSDVAQIDAGDRLIAESWRGTPPPEDEGRHDGAEYFQRLAGTVNIVCAPSVLMRREVFERLDGFDPRLPFTADWEMWLRIALFYDVGYLARPLVSYRRHDAMETAKFSLSQHLEQAYLAKLLVLEKYPDRVPDLDGLRARIAREYRDRALAQVKRALESGDAIAASEYLAVALTVCARARDGRRGDDVAVAAREVFAALVRALDERDRTIDAMTRTRVWRMARRWWALKRAVGELLRRR